VKDIEDRVVASARQDLLLQAFHAALEGLLVSPEWIRLPLIEKAKALMASALALCTSSNHPAEAILQLDRHFHGMLRGLARFGLEKVLDMADRVTAERPVS
jgi:hypothetical protein